MADPQINPLHDPTKSATYHAPEGENKVVEWMGVTFLDGVDTPIPDNLPELGILLKGNKYFTVTTGETPPVALAAAASQSQDRGRDEHGRDDHNKRR